MGFLSAIQNISGQRFKCQLCKASCQHRTHVTIAPPKKDGMVIWKMCNKCAGKLQEKIENIKEGQE